MPIYEFQCRECAEQFDRLVSYDWKSNGVHCPECGSHELERVVSLVGVYQSSGKTQLHSSNGGCACCSTGSCSTCN